MSRAFLLLLVLLTPSCLPLAAAAPVDDALEFQDRQTKTTLAAADALTREGFDAYFEAIDEIGAAQAQAGEDAFDAYDAANAAAFGTLAAATTDAFDGLATGSDGVWTTSQEGSDALYTGYDGALAAQSAATRGAADASYELVRGTGQNAIGLLQGVELPIDALGPASGAVRALTDQGFQEYFEAVNDTTTGLERTTEAGLQTYGSSLDLVSRTSRAAGDDVFTSYEESLRAADRVTFDATNTTFNGYFTTLNTTEDLTFSAGSAAFGAYFGAVDVGFDAARSATDAGFDAYFTSVDAGFGLLRTTSDTAFDGYFGALRTGGDLLYTALVPCTYAEGGGWRVGGTGDCVGQGVLPNNPESSGYDGEEQGSASAEPSAAASTEEGTADGPTTANGPSPQWGPDPYNCPQNPQQYGIRVLRTDGTTRAQCIPVATSGAGALVPVNDNRDGVRLLKQPTANTLTLDFHHLSGQVRGFELILGRTMIRYEMGEPADDHLIGQTTSFVLQGVQVTLFGGSALQPTVKLHYEGGAGPLVKFKLVPDHRTPSIYYRIESGAWQQGGVTRGNGNGAKGFDLTATFDSRSVDRADFDIDLALPSAEDGLKIEIGTPGAPVVLGADSAPAHIRFADASIQQRRSYGEPFDTIVKGDLQLSTRIPTLYLPIAGIDAVLRDVSSITGLEYRQVKVYYDGSGTRPCDDDLYEAIGDIAIGEEQICLTGTLTQPDMAVELDGGSVKLEWLPAAKVRFAFGPLGGIHYTEVQGTTGTGRTLLSVDENPKFGDIKKAKLDNLQSLLFVPGTSIAGDESGAGDPCSGSGAPPQPANGVSDMQFSATFAKGLGTVVVDVGAADKKVKLDLGSVSEISAVGSDFTMVFAESGGAIYALEASVVIECSPAKLKLSPTAGVIRLRVTTRDGSSDEKAFLMFDELRLTHGTKLSFDAKGTVKGLPFHLWGHAKRHTSGDYYGEVELEIDGAPEWDGKKDGDFGANRGTDHFTYTYRNPKEWFAKLHVVTFRLARGVA